ncbi:MAG: hypothetical protein ABI818_04230 [Acidobacteriota bacterium]
MKQRGWLMAATIAIGLSNSAAAQDAPPRDPDFREQVARVAARESEPGAQDAPTIAAKVAIEKMLPERVQMQGEVRATMAVGGRTTKGAPYTAEAISESTQTLADGNHIVRKNVTRVYRDGEGRTRREEINDGGGVQSVSIIDPVAGTSIMLQPETRTAYRNASFFMISDVLEERMTTEGKGGGGRVVFYTPATRVEGIDKVAAESGANVKQEIEQQRIAQYADGMVPPPPPPPPPPGMFAAREDGGTTQREDLGSQNLDGVGATGTRTTMTIAAGAIGNEHPIEVVSEQWFSPELQVLVLTKHSDPRQGDTTYRLANIVRAEPDRSLFAAPPDYTFKESGIRQRQKSQ